MKATPVARLERGGILTYEFTLPSPGEAWASLTLAAPGTSWARGETAVASLEIDGGDTQQLVLAGADEPVEYARLLGRLSAGPHQVAVRFDAALSAAGAAVLECHALRTHAVADDEGGAFVWRHAPVLHYRALDGPLDGLSTDTPLLLFYRPVQTPEGRGVEYHVINSHEDAGTDLTGLLAVWGHTTDIEWVFRIVRDACGRIVREEFQGPEHVTRPFRGPRALGGHPVLQASTRNGMVTDRITCPYRVALAPAIAQPHGEPREGVQYRFPWIQRVSSLEVVRQEHLDGTSHAAADAPADPRAYAYLQFKRDSDAVAVPLEALVRIRGAWHGSAWGRADLAMRGDDAESTAVKLPPGAGDGDVEAIAIRAIEPRSQGVTVRFVRAYCLDDEYRPRTPFAVPADGRPATMKSTPESPAARALTAAAPEATMWTRP
ncbi:MAG TPA: hypothetical protein VKT83_13235 [bacterium]|nr:hypothetical protein [bacterium]